MDGADRQASPRLLPLGPVRNDPRNQELAPRAVHSDVRYQK